MSKTHEAELHASFGATLHEADAYFIKHGRLHQTLRRLAERLQAEHIDYALVGSLALGEHGFARMT